MYVCPGTCPLYNNEHAFNDPLQWWKPNCVKCPYTANVAHLYLAVAATSAPSERVWSHAARILSLHCARLDDKPVGSIMFVREHIKYLRKHYCKLAKEETESHSHFLVDLELEYLPPLVGEEEEEGDVGQNDHLLEF